MPGARLRLPALCFAFLALLLAAAPGSIRAQGLEGFQDPIQEMQVHELENGLTILTLEDHTTPVVSFQIWVKVGSGDEARWTGLAHLFEHMMFRGSEHLPPEAHQQILEKRGARINAFTSRDVTVYFADITAEHLPLVIELEAERLGYLDISEESLASERQVVIEERRMRSEDDPQGRAFEALLALTWQAHPYRIPTVGWKSDLEKVGVRECRAFFDEYYAANNLVVAVSGDFDTEETLALLRRHLGGLRHAETIERNPTTEPEQRGERRSTIHFDVEAPILSMAWHAPPTGHADAEALDVASEILSSGRTSRLYRSMVYGKPVAMQAAGAYWELRRAGVFYAFVSVRPDASIDEAESLFLDEIARLREAPVTEQELEKARRSLEVSLIGGLGTSHALASRMGREWVNLGRVRPLEERLAAIRAVTAEDVQRVARSYLRPERRSVVRVVPPPEGSE